MRILALTIALSFLLPGCATKPPAEGEELRALFVLDENHAWAIGDRVRPGPQTMLRYRGSGGGRA